MVNKPESKIKSITGEGREFTALFEDGSVWLRYYHKNTNEYLWECILEAHKELPDQEPTITELEETLTCSNKQQTDVSSRLEPAKEWPKCKNPSGVFELCTFEDGKCTGCGELEGEG